MKYVMLIRIDETEPGPEVLMPAYDQFTDDLHKQGGLVRADRLSGPSHASTVRVQQGKTIVSDGPYAETKEWLCGLYVVDCKNLNEALAIAAKITSAPYGVIEVLPVIE